MNTKTPFDIAEAAYQDVDGLSAKETGQMMLWAALDHYNQGHWAEARTAALIGKLAVELSYA